MATALAAIRRACVTLGVLATISFVLALMVMLFIYDAPPVAHWFAASVALAALAFATAFVAAYFAP